MSKVYVTSSHLYLFVEQDGGRGGTGGGPNLLGQVCLGFFLFFLFSFFSFFSPNLLGQVCLGFRL